MEMRVADVGAELGDEGPAWLQETAATRKKTQRTKPGDERRHFIGPSAICTEWKIVTIFTIFSQGIHCPLMTIVHGVTISRLRRTSLSKDIQESASDSISLLEAGAS